MTDGRVRSEHGSGPLERRGVATDEVHELTRLRLRAASEHRRLEEGPVAEGGGELLGEGGGKGAGGDGDGPASGRYGSGG